MSVELQEKRRLEIQTACDAAKDQPARNRLGQFATPPELAKEIVRSTARLFGGDEPISFLDPAVGTGVFFSALLGCVEKKRIKRALGFEIDTAYGEPARELWLQHGLELRFQDFTRAIQPQHPEEKFNLVICNPPYVRHHHLTGEDKKRLRDTAQRACGAHINGLAGLYCYFLAIAQSWMTPGGLAAWLVPSEFMDVNYGSAVKDYLLSRVTLLRIHRFDPNDVQFGDALVSSAVVWFRNTVPTHDHAVEFSFGNNIGKPARARTVFARELRVERKWTRLTNVAKLSGAPGITLGDFFTIRRGLATGANSFFVLTPEEGKQHRIPQQFLVPIMPSPRYMPCDEVFADGAGNPVLDRKLFLLDCRLPEDRVQQRYPDLWSYLERGRAAGLARRYLCASRSPWYAQENRPPSQFLCTYIGRSDTSSGRPFRFILNHSRATAANVYLFLYPKPEIAAALQRDQVLARDVWQKLNEIDTTTMIAEGRVYGGGLHKLEPNELANVPADALRNLVGGVYSSKPQQLFLCEGKASTKIR
jgi:adenine-specific DNA-methyltransferase